MRVNKEQLVVLKLFSGIYIYIYKYIFAQLNSRLQRSTIPLFIYSMCVPFLSPTIYHWKTFLFLLTYWRPSYCDHCRLFPNTVFVHLFLCEVNTWFMFISGIILSLFFTSLQVEGEREKPKENWNDRELQESGLRSGDPNLRPSLMQLGFAAHISRMH